MKHDIFISYRRDGGFEIAKLIYEKLTQKKYSVFFDIDSMRGGYFNEQIYNEIDSCKNVVLILSKGALDRCGDPNDWVRQEINYAMRKHKIIIPVLVDDFEFPPVESLPHELQKLVNCQAVFLNRNLFDECLNKLCKDYLIAKPHHYTIGIIAGALAAVVIIATVLVLFLNQKKDTGITEFSDPVLGWRATFSENWINQLELPEYKKNLDEFLGQNGSESNFEEHVLAVTANDNSVNILLLRRSDSVEAMMKLGSDMETLYEQMIPELKAQWEYYGNTDVSCDVEQVAIAGEEYYSLLTEYTLGDGVNAYWPGGTKAYLRSVSILRDGLIYTLSITSFNEDYSGYVLEKFKPL